MPPDTASEKGITLIGPERLAARLALNPGAPGGLVVCHPHPLYGGSMNNNVVAALVTAGIRAGWSTLRFNFRGAGGSSGIHGGGTAERDDLLTAVDHLIGQGLDRVVVAGYSFGVWVASGTDFGSRPVVCQIWVAPPVGMMPIDPGSVRLPPGLVFHGGRDDIGPPELVEQLLAALPPARPEAVLLEGADHFYGGFEERLTRETAEWLDRLPAPGAR